MFQFKIEANGITTVFTNDSDMYVVVSLLPVKPKRKQVDVIVIRPQTFVIYDMHPLDLSKICFKFETKKEVVDERS